jgi:hypothetical protein
MERHVTPHLPAREVSRIAATTRALLGRSRRARDRLQLARRERPLLEQAPAIAAGCHTAWR